MSTRPAPSATRGDITLQPAYFTSSLFVNPLREDIARLIRAYAEAYLAKVTTTGSVSTHNLAAQAEEGRPSRQSSVLGEPTTDQPGEDAMNTGETSTPAPEPFVPASLSPDAVHLNPNPLDITGTSVHPQPFALFKQLWRSQGWCWFHFKVFDGRARERFLNVVLRLFSEYFADEVNPLAQVVALFGMYTFFSTQPTGIDSSSAAPLPGPSLFRVRHIGLSYDTYNHLLTLPTQLTTPQLSPLALYVSYLLSNLLEKDAFHIYPHSSLKTRYTLPREWFQEDTETPLETDVAADGQSQKAPKKKGRPGKRDRAKKSREALVQLDRWLDKSTYAFPDPPAAGDGTFFPVAIAGEGGGKGKRTTHTLISHPPTTSLMMYEMQKMEYFQAVDEGTSARNMTPDTDINSTDTPVGQTHASGVDSEACNPELEREKEKEALRRANEAMLARLKKIDEMAAEQGLEVGGEGGEMTGLERVERAVKELRKGSGSGRQGGILNLVEGAGVEHHEGRNGTDVAMDMG
ncbi:hypothetical protein BC835DRAFT_1415020 [Cytidiella melzeri]|nr:hypothetical protein BC835DRAFT_1415020 [Cytidiella melzeri]